MRTFTRQRSKSFRGSNVPKAVQSVVVVPKGATHFQLQNVEKPSVSRAGQIKIIWFTAKDASGEVAKKLVQATNQAANQAALAASERKEAEMGGRDRVLQAQLDRQISQADPQLETTSAEAASSAGFR